MAIVVLVVALILWGSTIVALLARRESSEPEYEVDWGPTIAAEIERQETARAR